MYYLRSLSNSVGMPRVHRNLDFFDRLCLWIFLYYRLQHNMKNFLGLLCIIETSCQTSWSCLEYFWLIFSMLSNLNPILLGGGTLCPPPLVSFLTAVFCGLTDKTLKLILYDLSTNFILSMWPKNFFGSIE